ncbi:MAG: DUF4070 domain-containing protein, partial [Moorea sp. SIO2B7]|nr:DUF4070 domain-containing protein [Moorena sp. SIO2B7]
GANINQTTLLNFVPTRPVEEIAREYVEAFWRLYDPERFLNRIYNYLMKLGLPRHGVSRPIDWITIRALLTICWRQGVVRKTRWTFWKSLFKLIQQKPKVVGSFFVLCAYAEHFLEYRQIVRDQIEAQLAEFMTNKPAPLPAKNEEVAVSESAIA